MDGWMGEWAHLLEFTVAPLVHFYSSFKLIFIFILHIIKLNSKLWHHKKSDFFSPGATSSNYVEGATTMDDKAGKAKNLPRLNTFIEKNAQQWCFSKITVSWKSDSSFTYNIIAPKQRNFNFRCIYYTFFGMLPWKRTCRHSVKVLKFLGPRLFKLRIYKIN